MIVSCKTLAAHNFLIMDSDVTTGSQDGLFIYPASNPTHLKESKGSHDQSYSNVHIHGDTGLGFSIYAAYSKPHGRCEATNEHAKIPTTSISGAE
jgi:hypothetical protein